MNKKYTISGIILASAVITPLIASAGEVVVKQGDTLYSISQQHQATIDNIKSWNNLTSDNIIVGQRLIISQERKGTIINATNLNMRTGPGVEFPVTAIINEGIEFQILNVSGTWHYVKLGNNTGYVSSYYVKEAAEQKLSTIGYITQTSGLFKEVGKTKVSSLAPQRVTILTHGTDGWYQIQTWLGPLWVKNGVTEEKIELPMRVYISQSSSLFVEPGKGKKSTITPQYVNIIQYGTDGWLKINTWLGPLWVKNGVTTETVSPATQKIGYLTKTSGLFKEIGKGKVSSIGPQRVTILKSGTDGWYQIETWLGALWVKDGTTEEYKAPAPAPAPAPVEGQTIIYTVVSGDNLTKIAEKYNTTVSEIIAINRLTTTTLQIGQKLTISENIALKIFTMPILGNNLKVSSNYGPRWGTIHYGADFSNTGQEAQIVAAADGVVSRSHMHSSYGEVIYIKHVINGKNYETLYAHMKEGTRAVGIGDKVKEGQFIGWMGSTGHSTGPHLHFEVHIGMYTYRGGTAVNPLPYIK